MGFLAGMGLPRHCSVIAIQRTGAGLPMGLTLMGLVVDVVEVLGAIISNSSYGDRIGNCSLEIGASISGTSANVGNAACRITHIIYPGYTYTR